MPGIVGGIVGAALATAGIIYMQPTPELPEAAAARLKALEETLAASADRTALEERLAAAEGAFGALKDEIAGLAGAPETDRAALDAALASATERLDKLEAALAAAGGGEAGGNDALAGLEQQIVDLTARIDELAESASGQDEGALIAAQAALTGQLATVQDDLAGLRAELESLAAAQQGAKQERETALAEFGASLDAQLSAADEATAKRLEAFESRIGEIAAEVETLRSARARAAGAALLAEDVRNAVEDGSGLGATLDDLAAMAGQDEALQAILADLAPVRDGVPTRQDLLAGLDALEQAARGDDGDSEDASWIDRTVGNITGLVERKEPVAGDGGPLARIAAAREAVRDGDLEAAISDIEGLELAPAQEWVSEARRRQAALDAARSLQDHVRTLLTSSIQTR